MSEKREDSSPAKEEIVGDEAEQVVPDFPEPVLKIPEAPVESMEDDSDANSSNLGASREESSNSERNHEEEIVFGESGSTPRSKKDASAYSFSEDEEKFQLSPSPSASGVVNQKSNEQSADPISIANSKGAQIIMNRFSAWRQTANQNAQELLKPVKIQAKLQAEGVGQLWKQGPAADFQKNIRTSLNELRKPIPTTDGASFVDTSTIGDEEDEVSSDNSEPATGNTSLATSTSTIDGGDGDANIDNEDTLHPMHVGKALNRASSAASVVAESMMTTNFRGRYTPNKSSSDIDSKKSDSSRKDPKQSQTDLILKARGPKHMQDILDGLDETHEYAMLLNSGMLGVNLKQCYLKNHGVFVDFLVEGGQASRSGVVRPGDLLLKIGNIDLRKGTIVEIPGIIAKARRPEVLALATGTKVTVERVNYVDIAVAMMHRARSFYNERGSLANKLMNGENDDSESSNDEKVMDNVRPSQSVEESAAPKSVSKTPVPLSMSLDSYLTPPIPPLELRKEFLEETASRSYDNFIVSGLVQVAEMDSNFRNAVRNAFLTVASDSRRLPFLARHLSSDEGIEHDRSLGDDERLAPSAQLMLYLELTSFLELYDITPQCRLHDVASRIAYKFFLPQVAKNDNRLQPPLFDFHQIVPDSSLRKLEASLKDKKVHKNLYGDFLQAITSMLCGVPFISFLTSIECARMRAHLRGAAPFLGVPLRQVIDSLVSPRTDPNAQRYAAYILLFLVCQLEKEPVGEHTFSGDESARLSSSAIGFCCSIFIRKILLPAITNAENDDDKHELTVVLSQFWDHFIDGSLKSFPKSNDTEIIYKSVRIMMERISAKYSRMDYGDESRHVKIAESLKLKKTIEELQRLSEELVYDYAVSSHVKFRENKFHEWMCSECLKVREPDVVGIAGQRIPSLPQGCIKRALRRIDLPRGVSSHKPYKTEMKQTLRNYHNADFAVVFGSTLQQAPESEGLSTCSQSPAVTRFLCQPVALDKEDGVVSLADEDLIPPTFETYAVTPPCKHAPFSSNEVKISDDGWSISLVNFSLPNAESSTGDASDSGVFGVSLTFTLRKDPVSIPNEAMKTEIVVRSTGVRPNVDLHHSKEIKNFVSPIKYETVSDGSAKDNMIRKIEVPSPAPQLNQWLQEKSWLEGIVDNCKFNRDSPISIGLSLVSRNNVIIAMRETLSKLLFDFCRTPNEGAMGEKILCRPLVELLGAFSGSDIEGFSLKSILEPYLHAAMSPWTDLPLQAQREAFELRSLGQLAESIPPTPLALMFVTALLEQKIVFSSSRRSILQSACMALTAMLRPLKWSHLLVPLVPASLANDLIHYPAPFIIGIPAQDAENMELLSTLPKDVTLVDLDVGRVILAPSFGKANEMVNRAENTEVTAQALRSQVLYLAQVLGNVFGASLHSSTWACDSPLLVNTSIDPATNVKKLQQSAKDFIAEILEGTPSCSYWVEEASNDGIPSADPTVLFDEDRFLSIKNDRANGEISPLFRCSYTPRLALSLDEFDLVLESFLRCQSMSLFISSQSKEEMLAFFC